MTIKLDIVSFKSLSDYTVTFDAGSITLLSGKSGCGKTSIIEALLYALFGRDLIPYNVVPHGKKSCRVAVDWHGDFTIERTNNKAGLTLTIKSDGTILRDDNAQRYIYDRICSSDEYVTTYLKSWPDHFMDWMPANQWKLIRSMAIRQNIDIDAIHKTINVRRRSLQTEADKLAGRIEWLESNADIHIDPDQLEADYKRWCLAIPLPPRPPHDPAAIREMIRRRTLYEDAVKKLGDIDPATLPTLRSEQERWKRWQRVRTYPGDEAVATESQRIQEWKTFLELEPIRKAVSDLEAEYQRAIHMASSETMTCPSCKCSLVMADGQLQRINNQVITKYEELVAKLGDRRHDAPNPKPTRTMLQNLVDQHARHVAMAKTYHELAGDPPTDDPRRTHNIRIIEEWNALDHTDIPTATIDDMNEWLSKWALYNKAVSDRGGYDGDATADPTTPPPQLPCPAHEVPRLVKDLREWQSAKRNHADAIQSMNDYEHIQKTIIQTEIDMIQNMVNTMNVGINSILETFFDDPIQIVFSVDSSKLKHTIHYRGAETSYKNLSAGEGQRVLMAVHLWFIRYFNFPILIIDEITNNLDMETTFTVFESIKSLFGDTMVGVVVAHQVVEGIFDRVVRV